MRCLERTLFLIEVSISPAQSIMRCLDLLSEGQRAEMFGDRSQDRGG